MQAEALRQLLDQVARGEIAPAAATEQLRAEADLGFAKADLDRAARCGIDEVIYAEGKTPEQVVALWQAFSDRDPAVLATRASADHAAAVQAAFPQATYHAEARILSWRADPIPLAVGHIAVVAAGTSDLPVAEEAAVTAAHFGARVERFVDVGVAGLHRLINRLDAIRQARVVIAVAGMEGALPSVLAGLIEKPLIAVPTRVGYGLHFNGLAAALAMLNSCAPGVTIVNVDNGFGAAIAATKINRLGESATGEGTT
jgi:pyridinium-3,5-biscarboxylic acid mononucleotide synthase